MTQNSRPTPTSAKPEHGLGSFLIVLMPIMLAFSLSQFSVLPRRCLPGRFVNSLP